MAKIAQIAIIIPRAMNNVTRRLLAGGHKLFSNRSLKQDREASTNALKESKYLRAIRLQAHRPRKSADNLSQVISTSN